MSDEAQQSAAGAPAETPAEGTAPEAAPEPAPSFMRRFFAKKRNLMVIVVVVAVIVIAAVVAGGGGAGGGGLFSSKAAPAPTKLVEQKGGYALAGPQVLAGQSQEFPIQFNSSDNGTTVTNVYEVDVSCSWTDDYAGSEPDSMTFELKSPDGKNDSKTTEGTSGSCQLSVKSTNVTDKKVDDNTNGWVLKVTCNYAGHKDVGPFGFLIYVDAGNNFDAKISYNYYGHPASK